MLWIPVSERLPEHMATVLGFVVEGGLVQPYDDDHMIDTICYNQQRRCWQQNVGTDDVDVKVTHWMPLPEDPPEGSKL